VYQVQGELTCPPDSGHSPPAIATFRALKRLLRVLCLSWLDPYLEAIRQNEDTIIKALDPEVEAADTEADHALAFYIAARDVLYNKAGLRLWISDVCRPTRSGKGIVGFEGPRRVQDNKFFTDNGFSTVKPSEALEALNDSANILEGIRELEVKAHARHRHVTGQKAEPGDDKVLAVSRHKGFN